MKIKMIAYIILACLTISVPIFIISKIKDINRKERIIYSEAQTSKIDLAEGGRKYTLDYQHNFPWCYRAIVNVDYKRGIKDIEALGSLTVKLRLQILNDSKVVVDKIITNKSKEVSFSGNIEFISVYSYNAGSPHNYRLILEVIEPETSKYYEKANITVTGCNDSHSDLMWERAILGGGLLLSFFICVPLVIFIIFKILKSLK